MKPFLKNILKVVLFIGFPLTFISALWLKFVRKMGISKISEKIFMKLGVLPIVDYYYEPLINPKKHLTKSLRADRELRAIDFNIQEQLSLLLKFSYSEELIQFPIENRNKREYYYNNSTFISGDSEFLYNMVRHFKPQKFVEIGSGISTLMVRNAVEKNCTENPHYVCNHICIEPYHSPWLEELKIQLIRDKVENVDKSYFEQLQPNDILFIDSSHIIRPQGDVLLEYLELLPLVKSGVIVHVHDIFSPKDYPDEWVYNHSFWNEQYLLEAFLSFNKEFRIIGAVNFLAHNYRKELGDKCPVFNKQPGKEPGSFWMVRN